MALQRTRTQALNGLGSLEYVGVRPSTPTNFFIKQKAPSVNDYRNVYVGDLWLDNSGIYLTPAVIPTVLNLWILVSVTNHIATWRNFASGVGTVTSVNPGLNISITGTATDPIVNVTGTTDHSVLLGNATGSINSLVNGTTGQYLIAQTGADPIWSTITNANSFPTDVGIATPAAGVLTIKANVATLGCGESVQFTGSGSTVLLNVTDTNSNTVIGNLAGRTGMTSTNCTVLGKSSFTAATTGSRNTIIGANVAGALSTGTDNNIFGEFAGSFLTGTETFNILIADRGVAGLDGYFGIAIPTVGGNGFQMHNYPARRGVNGSNVFIGKDCGNKTMTVNAVANFALGDHSLDLLTTGDANCAIGVQSGHSLTTGRCNTLLGHSAGDKIIASTGVTTGNFNVAIGYTAGSEWTGAESNNICIGTSVGVTGESNVTRIGDFTVTPQTKCFIQGIRGITTVNANAIAVLIDSAGQLGTVSSSARYKDNIKDLGSYSDVLYKLRPVEFNYKKHSTESKSVGLIAEEVAEHEPRLVVYDEEGLPETVRYQDIVPMLLNELQKLRVEFDEYKKNHN